MTKLTQFSLRLAIAVLASAMLSSCDLFQEDSRCGPELVVGEDVTFLTEAPPRRFTRGGDVVFRQSLADSLVGRIVSVCTHEHVHAEITADVAAQPLKAITVQGIVDINVFFEQRFAVDDRGSSSRTGFEERSGSTPSGGVGLSQVFGDGPGDYDVAVEFSFDSSGSVAQDEQYFKDNVKSYQIVTRFFQFKASSSPVGP